MYGGAVSHVEGNPAAGEVVDVVDSSGKFIAWGKTVRSDVIMVQLTLLGRGKHGSHTRQMRLVRLFFSEIT